MDGVTESIRARDVQGGKYLARVLPLLARLHEAGCERDRAGNRQLHLDQYCALVLLFMFSPAIDSLRGLAQMSGLRKVQKQLGCQRMSLGSLSESVRIFDPALIEGLIQELAADLKPQARDPRLAEIKLSIQLADGTLLPTLMRVAEAAWATSSQGEMKHAWRLHTQFSLDLGVPTRMDLTSGRNGGETSERKMLQKHLAPDCLYVADRGYHSRALLDAIVNARSSYVLRVPDDTAYEVLADYPLTDEDRAAGVVRDMLVQLGRKDLPHPNHPVRLILIQTKEHAKRSHRKGNRGAGPTDGLMRMVTNVLDPPAATIGLIYSHRYAIELFFRFFKHLLGCRHLLSNKSQGVQIQVYCAIIACLLLARWTNRKPTKRTLEMLSHYFSGWAEEDELEAHLRGLAKNT